MKNKLNIGLAINTHECKLINITNTGEYGIITYEEFDGYTHVLMGPEIVQERIIQFNYNNIEHQKLLISKLRYLGEYYHKYIALCRQQGN